MQRNSTKIHITLLIIVCIVFLWSMIKPAGYLIWTLEVLPAVIGLIVLIITYHKFHFSTLSYTIVAVLSMLMFIGGHYTYDNVPLFEWIKDTFNLSRNHYDRFGHLMKGFISIVIRELLIRKSPLKKGLLLSGIVISISLSIAALYEIIEWLYSVIRSNREDTKEFLGMQGDIWDAQWDMSLALIGSIIALLLLSKVQNKIIKSFK